METKIHVLSFGMVNAYLLVGEQNILVDTGQNGQFDNLVKKVEACGIAMEDIDLLVITHVHNDHYANAAKVKEQYNTPIAVHESVYIEGKPIVEQEAIPNTFLAKVIKLALSHVKIDTFVPDISLSEGDSFETRGVNCQVMHIPGHTIDSIALVVNDDQIIVGDTVASNRKRKPIESMFLNDRITYMESIKRLLDLNPQSIYCSHGTRLNRDEIQDMWQWL